MSAKEAPTIALLSRAHSPTSVTRIHTEKIQHRPLLLKASDPTTTNPSASARQQRHLARVHKLEKRKKRLKPRPLTAKEKRASQIYTIPKAGQKYDIYKALHGMWEAYIRDVLFDGHEARLNGPVTPGTAAKLVSADYHGAELEVVRSRCVGRVGIKGIVIKDTMYTFELITKNNVVKTVPKESTVFRFKISPTSVLEQGVEEVQKDVEGESKPGGSESEEEDTIKDVPKVEDGVKPLVFEIYGSQFLIRSSDRAVRKPKLHYFPDL